MNELIFLAQVLIVTLGALGSYRLGAHALVSFISLCAVLANLFVLKGITLFGLSVTAADSFSVGAMLALTMLQEKEGKQQAQKAIIISFFALIFYTLVSQLHIWYEPSHSDIFSSYYQALLQTMPRLTLASLAAYFLSQQLTLWLYEKIPTSFSRFSVVRTYGAVLLGQLADTFLFTFLGLYGILPHLGVIMLFSFSIKAITLSLATPCVALAKRL